MAVRSRNKAWQCAIGGSTGDPWNVWGLHKGNIIKKSPIESLED